MIIPFPKTHNSRRKKDILAKLGVYNDYIDALEKFKTEWSGVISTTLAFDIDDELDIIHEQSDALYRELADIEEELIK